MRILRISLENLASLSGRHNVDFTREPLRSAGLFAIIGPTGSGKSTLLDAMCLALYDHTPRLKLAPSRGEEVNQLSQQDARALLRRGAAAGMAEVAFVGVDGQTWTAQWKVRRARNKADGQLQQSTMALYRGNLQDGQDEQLQTGGKKTEVLAAIHERVGLTFDQFTRAVLLAQNEFSAFLKSKDEDRAAILEALTGTELFRAVSKAVHERTKKLNNDLENLRTRLQGNAPLSDTDRADLDQQWHAVNTELRSADDRKKQWETQRTWYQRLTELQAECERASNSLQEATQLNQQAATARHQLAIREQIQRESRGLVQQLDGATSRHSLAAAAFTDATAAAEKARTQQTDAEQTRLQAQQADTQLRNAHAALEPECLAALELDTRINSDSGTLQGARTELQRAEGDQQRHDTALENCRAEIHKQTEQRQGYADRLQQYEHLQPLAAQGALWLQYLDALRDVDSSLSNTRSDALALQEKKSTLEAEIQQLQADQDQQQLQRQSLAAQQGQIADELQQLAPDSLYNELTALSARKNSLTGLQRSLQTLDDRQEALQTATARFTDRNQSLQQQISTLDSVDSQLPEAEKQAAAARLAEEFLRNALDDHAERLRAALQPDRPCPVCGAAEHPWHAEPPGIQQTALQEAQRRHQQLAESLQQFKADKARLQGIIEGLRDECQQLQDDQQPLRKKVEEAEQDLQQFRADPDTAQILEFSDDQRHNAITEQLRRIDRQTELLNERKTRIHELEQRRQTLNADATQLDDGIRKLVEEASGKSNSSSELAGRITSALRQCEQLQQALQQQEERLQPLWQQLPDGAAEFQAAPAAFRTRLQQAWLQIEQLSGAIQTCDRLLEVERGKLPGLQQAVTEAAERTNQRAQTLQEIEQSLEELQKRRAGLLGGKTVAAVREEQRAGAEESSRGMKAAESRFQETKDQCTAATTNAQNAETTLKQVAHEVTTAEANLAEWLRTFQQQQQQHEQPLDQTQLRDILAVPHADLQAERQRLQDLQDAETRCRERSQASLDLLQQHRNTDPPALTPEELEQRLQALHEQLQTLQDQASELGYRQREDNKLRSENAAILTELQEKEVAARPWQQLNDLIGAADGKKFNLLAQRITLDLLLQHANVQLREFSSRYRLERLGESLNLVIVDQHLGDERRSVHSLSGGETFLASLALALGLASLTSNRVRIESLFIDEGFGSLDEETLETAMNALGHLQSQGRRVGIITHVERMKDAIPVQVRVQRASSGTSRIVLPRSQTAAEH